MSQKGCYATNISSSTDTLGTTTFTYSTDNRLDSVSGPLLSAKYLYNAIGDRVSKIQGTNVTNYVLDYSGPLVQPLQEVNSAGVIKAINVYGIGLIARIDSAGNIHYYHFNPQHNTVALSNDTGGITDTYTYLSSGRVWKHIGNTIQPFTFLGEYSVQQESSNLFYIRARYYDISQNGRFISKDNYPSSLGRPQTLNRYVYGLNNPISLFDPSGNCIDDNGSKKGQSFIGASEIINELVNKLTGSAIFGDLEEVPNISFFQNAFYSPKVEQQMNNLEDVFHSFPKDIENLASEFGQWTTQIGGDGAIYEWLKLRAIFKGQKGTFEFTKDSNGEINHRFFEKDPTPDENASDEIMPEEIMPGDIIIID